MINNHGWNFTATFGIYGTASGKISVENISGASRIPLPKKEEFWSKYKV